MGLRRCSAASAASSSPTATPARSRRAPIPRSRRISPRAWHGVRVVLAAIEGQRERLERLRGPAPAPRFDQDWFPTLDAAAAYAMVGRARPARIVEVGSGHSTRFLARAIADAGLAAELVSIDPAPRAPLRGLPVRWIASVVQRRPRRFGGLQAGDVLFIDSSHILMPGTDVDWLLNRVLPGLAVGVLVHFHDIFLPDPYPAAWAWRGYNEQQALAPLLQGRPTRACSPATTSDRAFPNASSTACSPASLLRPRPKAACGSRSGGDGRCGAVRVWSGAPYVQISPASR